jgi:hypothetical protein
MSLFGTHVLVLGLGESGLEMTTPTLTSFAAPRGGRARPWGGPADGATTPTLTSFAAPRGGCARPWGGPADGTEEERK